MVIRKGRMIHATPGLTTAFIEAAIAYSGTDCLLWPFGKTAGYGRIGKGYVHRLVCEAVHGPAPSSRYETAHNCGVRACINPAHLRWDTPKGNQADQIRHFGGQYANAVLTVRQVREILFQFYRSAGDLAKEYHVTPGAIDHIRHKRNWSWL
jgi:hypothetical protein